MLTDAEIQILQAAGFDQEVGELLRTHTSKPIELARERGDVESSTNTVALSLAVADGEEAEQLMNRITPDLLARGCRVFWSRRQGADELRQGDELLILRTTDDTEIIRFCVSDGANYGISTDDIIARLTMWRDFSKFDIVGADSDFVMLVFQQLPSRICDFAVEVNDFCPDTASQGVGIDRKYNNAEKIAESLELCLEVKATVRELPPEALDHLPDGFMDLLLADVQKNIRLLALKLRETNELFLWWD